MADVDINKFRASVVRDGSKPSSPGFIVSEGQDPVNPPGTNNYVPYSGATANVELGEYGVETGFITLDTTPTNTPTDQGTIFWDADDETVDIVLNGYTMKIGEDLFYPVKNQTGSTIAKGVAVRFAGTLGASGRLLIAPFIADGSVPSSRFMGVTAEEILNGEDGKVLYFGRVRGINTNAFNEGDILYASTTVAGGYQTAIPVAPNNIVQVAAVVTKSATVGTIFVRPTLGSNINTDEGVKIVSVADKNLLQYQSTTSLWENKSLAQVIGSDYVPSTRTITINGTTQDLSANRTFNVGTVTSVGLSSATSGVTIGSTPVTTSGTITLAIATASGSQNGLLSSTDWTTFNGKQNALTNPVTGTGTTNYLPKFTGSTTIGNSQVFDNGTNVGINTNTPLSTNLLGALTIVKSYSSDTPASTTAQTYYTNQSGLYLFGRNSGLTIIGANNEENQIIFANTSTVAFASINTGTGSNSTGGDMYFKVGSNTEAMRIFATTRNVHIGPTPASDNGAKLQVSGTARISGNGLFGGATALTGLNAGISVNGASNSGINFRTSDVLRGYVYTTSGNMWIETVSGSVILAPNGSPALTLASTGAATFSSSLAINGERLTIGGTTNNAVINNIASVRINIDSDNSGTGESFMIGHNQEGIDNSNVLFKVQDNGNVLIGSPPAADNGARLQVEGTASFNFANNSSGITFSRQTIGQLGSIINSGSEILYQGTGSVFINADSDSNGTSANREVKLGNRGVSYMTITSDGFLKASNNGSYLNGSYNEINSNTNNQEILYNYHSGTNPYGVHIYFNSAPNNGSNYFQRWRDGNATRAWLYSNGGFANFQANDTNLSDERVKKDIISLESYWDKFKAIEIVKFKYKDQTHEDFNIGVIAQQIESVAPEFVDIDGWGENPKNEEPLKSIYTADLYHATIKVLQEAMAKIEAMQKEIDTLKN